MRRETKWNIVLVVVLTAISVPGAVRMFVKKYNDPREMYTSDGRRLTVPYMMPNAGVTDRAGPAVVAAWADSFTAGETFAPPLMSPDVGFQVLGVDGSAADVMTWDATLTARAELAEATVIDVPEPIVEELRDGGYVRPPAEVALLRVPVRDGRVTVDGVSVTLPADR